MGYFLRRAMGFVVLGISTLTFLDMLKTGSWNFATTIGVILLIFAWTDYFNFIIHTIFALVVILGFFGGNFDGLFYAIPTGLAYLLFAFLLGRNRERLATFVFLLTVPLGIFNAHFAPVSSAIVWAIIGFMIGVIENAVIEEMAEGDVAIIALYFMALGPFAFIPLAFQSVTGFSLFTKITDGVEAYPLGPAMFIVSVPLFILIPHMVNVGVLPSWLFYAYYHGITNKYMAILFGVVGTYVVLHFFTAMREGGISFAGQVSGLIAGIVAGMASFAALVLPGVYIYDRGHEALAGLVFLIAILVALFVGGLSIMVFSKLHYEKKSSINARLWMCSMGVVAILLSMKLLKEAWNLFASTRDVAIGMGFLMTVLLWLLIRTDIKEGNLLTKLWRATLLVSAFVAGLWVGFGFLWITH